MGLFHKTQGKKKKRIPNGKQTDQKGCCWGMDGLFVDPGRMTTSEYCLSSTLNYELYDAVCLQSRFGIEQLQSIIIETAITSYPLTEAILTRCGLTLVLVALGPVSLALDADAGCDLCAEEARVLSVEKYEGGRSYSAYTPITPPLFEFPPQAVMGDLCGATLDSSPHPFM